MVNDAQKQPTEPQLLSLSRSAAITSFSLVLDLKKIPGCNWMMLSDAVSPESSAFYFCHYSSLCFFFSGLPSNYPVCVYPVYLSRPQLAGSHVVMESSVG